MSEMSNSELTEVGHVKYLLETSADLARARARRKKPGSPPLRRVVSLVEAWALKRRCAV